MNQMYSNWNKRTQKCFDDFFNLNFIFNSPELLLDNLMLLPLTYHLPLKQSIGLKTPLCKAKICYRKIEDGFWILTAEMDLEENIIMKSDYDKNFSDDYYVLTFSLFESNFIFEDSGSIKTVSSCWTFSKPGTEVRTPFYKDTSGVFFTFWINKAWVNKEFLSGNLGQQEAIESFFNEKKGFFTGLHITPKTNSLIKKMEGILRADTDKNIVTEDFKKDCLKLILDFFDSSFESDRIKKNVSLKNSDYYNVIKAEKIISDNFCLPFIGIRYIAREIDISPTKLKSDFKDVFGISILQYHKEKNMLFALQLLQNSDIRIKNIAILTGYGNTSNFTSSFKKRFKKLPYEVRCF